jgi:hypothetical protein
MRANRAEHQRQALRPLVEIGVGSFSSRLRPRRDPLTNQCKCVDRLSIKRPIGILLLACRQRNLSPNCGLALFIRQARGSVSVDMPVKVRHCTLWASDCSGLYSTFLKGTGVRSLTGKRNRRPILRAQSCQTPSPEQPVDERISAIGGSLGKEACVD